MIRLNNIQKNNDIITCTAYLEDCQIPLELRYFISQDAFAPFVFPEGYEWCRSHINQARFFLKSLKGNNYPRERLIMWY